MSDNRLFNESKFRTQTVVFETNLNENIPFRKIEFGKRMYTTNVTEMVGAVYF